ncbi:MAG: ABC transporter permease [Ktedonobacteraceae bacterium]
MTFMALLTKELRLRLRSERTMWGLVSYVVLIGLLGWFIYYSSMRSNSSPDNFGSSLYTWLIGIQFFLIFCMTPAYTSTAINGEKQRQTFDLLVCSQLSAFSLSAGKLVAGLVNALLLIAAVLPVFSLVFLFGGVSPLQFLETLLVFVVSALLLGTIGLFYSALLKSPVLSTTLTYFTCLVWVVLPYFLAIFWGITTNGSADASKIAYLWNPIIALSSVIAPGFNTLWSIPAWLSYTLLSLALSLLLFLLCVLVVKPGDKRSGRAKSKVYKGMLPAGKAAV